MMDFHCGLPDVSPFRAKNADLAGQSLFSVSSR